jgi:hypothetical protein
MRNWSDQYAAYLSETARPGHVPERRFTSLKIDKKASQQLEALFLLVSYKAV